RLEAAVQPLVGLRSAAGEALARLYGAALVDEILLLDGLDRVAALDRRDVEEPELRIVGGRLPVLAAEMRRAGARRALPAHAVVALGVNLNVLGRIVVERAASLRIEPGRPVELVDVLAAVHERAVHPVERVEEPVARRMHHELAVLAVDLGLDQ